MYCPKCSQQQVSDEIRFCPRCGFQLGAVKLLLSENQNLLVIPEQQQQIINTRKRDILLGSTIMLVGAILIALLMVSEWSGTPWQAVIIPLLLLWVAIVSVLLLSEHAVREVKKLFSKNDSALPSEDDSNLITQVNAAARNPALPPIYNAPVSEFGSLRVNTAELAQPLSVTEHTTNLLEKKD